MKQGHLCRCIKENEFEMIPGQLYYLVRREVSLNSPYIHYTVHGRYVRGVHRLLTISEREFRTWFEIK